MVCIFGFCFYLVYCFVYFITSLIFVCHIITFFLFVPTASVTQTLQKLCVVVRPKKQQVIHFYFYFPCIFLSHSFINVLCCTVFDFHQVNRLVFDLNTEQQTFYCFLYFTVDFINVVILWLNLNERLVAYS